MRTSFTTFSSMLMLLLVVPFVGTTAAQPSSKPSARASRVSKSGAASKADANGRAVYIVGLKDAPLASYTGGVAGIPATSPKATGARKLDSESASARSYTRYLADQRSKVVTALQGSINRTVEVVRTYDTAYNGFAVRLTEAEATTLERVSDVLRVQRDTLQQPQTDVGPVFIGAQQGDATRSATLFKATINAAQEVPPVGSTANGTATFAYNPTSKVLSFAIKLQRITPTLGHIHTGAGGVAGPVIHDLMPFMVAPNVYVGSVSLLAIEEPLLNSGGLYVNFHTTANPSGEIRGQILPDKGEGMLVGILDTGINFAHASFAAIGPVDGYVHTNPFGTGRYKGVCNPAEPTYQPTFQCNDKLVGAWSFTNANDKSPLGEPSPADNEGHGSHTASTTAGNVVTSTLTLADGSTFNSGHIAGVAPHANIIAYDIGDDSGATYSSIIAAIDQAVKDRVDVINYSFGGDSDDPWGDPSSLAFLNALDAGVFTSVAAGNSGPDAATIGAPSNAPWVMSVAASTHNRLFANHVTGLAGGDTPPPGDLTGAGLTPGLPASPIVYANNYLNTQGKPNALCLPFQAGQDVAGKIVVCERGTNGRVDKSDNVKAAGGAGFVLLNDMLSASSLNSDVFAVPGVHLSYADGVKLKAWLASGIGQTASVSGVSTDYSAANGDVMASFSARGPDANVPDVLKPDVSAPGLNVLAAVANTDANSDEFDIYSGTSMAAPHNAGAATLLRSLHPDWTVAEVQSALMTTAVRLLRKEDGTTPANAFDLGSGRIDVGQATQTGLVLNETAVNFKNSDPLSGGDPRTLNRASMADSHCIAICTWTRTVRNTLGVTATWNIAATGDASTPVTATPASFTVKPGGTQTITVTADVTKLALNTYGFGAVTLSPVQVGTATTNLSIPPATLPVVAQAVASNLSSYQYIQTDQATSTTTISDVLAIQITALNVQTHGLVRGTLTTHALSQDTNKTSTTDVLADGIYFQQQTVPTGTARLVGEIVDTTADDLDMYIYLDGSNGQPKDGKPQNGELVQACATGLALEYCNIDNPDAGTYIVLVQDYSGAKAPAQDMFKLSTAIVPLQSNGNFVVTGPQTQAAKTPFDVGLAWNLPLERNDHWYGAFDLGTNATSAGNLGHVDVDLVSTTTNVTLYAPLVSRP